MKRLEQDRGRAPKARPTHADRGAATKEEAAGMAAAARYTVDALPGAETAPEPTLAAFDRALVQCRAALAGAQPEAAVVQRAAVAGVSGNGGALPFAERIQRAFGRHDVSHVRAYTGGAASDAARTMGAMAYATGNRVAFRGTPDLHTAAHEAAHVVQQRRGIALEGGVGQAGDVWERHADAVADRVVRGMSAEDLLGPVSRGAAARHDGAVQKKVYIGPTYAAPQPTHDEKVNSMLGDDIVRRFASEQEVYAYASGQRDGCGELPDHTWVRVDHPLTVLGENHGDTKARGIIQATGIRDFRYEGFAHHNPNRMAADPAFAARVAESDQKHLARIVDDEDIEPDERDRSVEDALPLYARVVPDVLAYARGTIANLDGPVATHMADALRFARTYSGKWFHEIARFIRSHRAAVELAIPEFDKKDGNDRTKPDRLKLAPDMLEAMNEAFTSAARRKVELSGRRDRRRFEQSLGQAEAKTCATDEAETNDRLRDKSMLDTILAAEDDRLFVIGEGHRQRLAPLLDDEKVAHMKDTTYVEREKDRNRAADLKIPEATRATIAAVRDQKLVLEQPSGGNKRFKLECPDGFEWQSVANCQSRGLGAPTMQKFEVTPGQGRIRVELRLVHLGTGDVARTYAFDYEPPRVRGGDVGLAGPGNVPPPQPLAAPMNGGPATNDAGADQQVDERTDRELAPLDLE